MKPTLCVFTSMIVLSLLVTVSTKAQEVKNCPRVRPINVAIFSEKKAGDYSYQITPAPNNSFGYIIFQKSKVVFRQPRVNYVAANRTLNYVEWWQAERAALIAIEKVKKGKLPVLTNEEVKSLVTK